MSGWVDVRAWMRWIDRGVWVGGWVSRCVDGLACVWAGK